MPRLKNVTVTELDALQMEASEVQAEAADYAARLQQGYCDAVPEPLRRASAILAASRALADLAHALLRKATIDEQKRELESTLRGRAEGEP